MNPVAPMRRYPSLLVASSSGFPRRFNSLEIRKGWAKVKIIRHNRGKINWAKERESPEQTANMNANLLSGFAGAVSMFIVVIENTAILG